MTQRERKECSCRKDKEREIERGREKERDIPRNERECNKI